MKLFKVIIIGFEAPLGKIYAQSQEQSHDNNGHVRCSSFINVDLKAYWDLFKTFIFIMYVISALLSF